jgi:hypothetical protein
VTATSARRSGKVTIPPRRDDRLRLFSVLCAAGVGAASVAVVFYPGNMSPDSLHYFRQAISGVISGDVQPPVMAFVWMLLHRVVPGPFGMLLWHQLLFWTGLALMVLACRFRPIPSALCVLAVGWLPPIYGLLGVLWKDVGMGAGLTLGAGLVLYGKRRRSPRVIAMAMVPLFYALTMRLNGAPAIIPLAGWVCVEWVAARGRWLSSRAVVAASVAVTIAMVVLNSAVARMIVNNPRPPIPGTTPLQYSMIHDLAGISVRIRELRLPDYLLRAQPALDMATLDELYTAADVNTLVFDPRWDNDVFVAHDQSSFDELAQVWWQAVRAHPRAYLGHRAGVVRSILQVDGVDTPFVSGIHENDLGLRFEPSRLNTVVVRLLRRSEPIVFKGSAFLAVAIVLIVTGVRRHFVASVVLCSSGVLYILPYAVISSGSDFRYIWWLLIATALAIVVRISEVRDRAARAEGTSGSHGAPLST